MKYCQIVLTPRDAHSIPPIRGAGTAGVANSSIALVGAARMYKERGVSRALTPRWSAVLHRVLETYSRGDKDGWAC
jgi:hypothetical protein